MKQAKIKTLISVAIYLRGHELNPAHVSQVIGLQPTRFQRRGGLRAGSEKFVAKIGMWTLQAKSESRSVSNLVEDLLAKIGDPPVPLDQIEGVEDACLDIFIATDKDGNGKLEFPPPCGIGTSAIEWKLTDDHIRKLSQLGLSACFTVSRSRED